MYMHICMHIEMVVLTHMHNLSSMSRYVHTCMHVSRNGCVPVNMHNLSSLSLDVYTYIYVDRNGCVIILGFHQIKLLKVGYLRSESVQVPFRRTESKKKISKFDASTVVKHTVLSLRRQTTRPKQKKKVIKRLMKFRRNTKEPNDL